MTVRNPKTKKTRARPRDESEWVVVDMPELRIIDDETWNAVKARQEQTRTATREKQEEEGNTKARTGPGPKFLFSGILVCDACKGKLITISPGKYGCSNAYRAGTCTVKTKLDRVAVETALCKTLESDLFRKEAVDAFRKELAVLLKQRRDEFEPNIKKLSNQLLQVSEKIENLLEAIERGQHDPLVNSRLESRRQEQDRISAQLNLQKGLIKDVSPLLPRALDRYNHLVRSLPSVVEKHIPTTRTHLERLLGGQIMMRRSEHGGWEGYYRGYFSGLVRLGGSQAEISDETCSVVLCSAP